MRHLDDSKYSVYHRKEIISILEDLRKEQIAIKLAFSNAEEITTSIIEISDRENRVYLKGTADENLNLRIASSDHITFATRSGVNTKWRSTHIRLAHLPDGEVFSIQVPAVVQRIQRRENFRVPVPQGKNGLTSQIHLQKEVIKAPIKDISAGGICIALTKPLHTGFSQGAILDGCQIEFPALGNVYFKFKVCEIRSSNDSLCYVGAEFMDLNRGASNIVQRCMLQLEAKYRGIASAA